MSDAQGFWSYVHKDDKAEGERISRLAKDVAAQYEMETAETIDLFLDKDALEWGDEWREKIDDNLASVAFFIPVLTPRYFSSPECRRELHFFARRATKLGIKELVLPLLYVDVPSLHDEDPQDDLVELIRDFLWEDWRELRFEETASAGYRRGVSRLARRLVDANRSAEQVGIAQIERGIEEGLVGEEDDSPGLIDRMAMSEEALPKWNETIGGITTEIELIEKIMQAATSNIRNASPGKSGFSHRLVIAQRLARELSAPAEKIWTLSNDFASQFHEVDDGIRAFIELAPEEIEARPDSKEDVCRFFETVQQLSASVSEGLDATQQMIDGIAPAERMSRDLRPVLRQLRQGLTTMVEAREVSEGWVRLIEASGVDCSSA